MADRRRAAAAFVLHRLLSSLASLTPVVAVDRNGKRVFVSTSDQGDITRSVLGTGGYEAAIVSCAVDVVRRHQPERRLAEGWFIDVGANIGVTTLEMFERHGAVRGLALEPHSEVFSILRHNLLEAGIDHAVRVYNVGASDTDGTSELSIAPGNQGDHRLIGSQGKTRGAHSGARAVTRVDVRQLDSIIREAEIQPEDCVLVWVDTQGHEPRVLAGASSLIGAKVPFVCEYWPEGLEEAGLLAEFRQIVTEGFDFVVDLAVAEHVMTPRQLADSDWLMPSRRPYTNLALLHRNHADEVPVV
jgi:FkbM family methyltransferase